MLELDQHSDLSDPMRPNGIQHPSSEDLERELPVVFDGQVPLGDLLSRVMQSTYAELSELAETCVHG